MNISNFDLNLLRVFDMLLREQNVSRAAERLALTQPTVSNALARLRDQLGDPLLVRVGRRMRPTPRALALEGPIRAALQQIEQTLGTGDGFEPQRSHRQLRIALTDFVEQLCMPPLLARLQLLAPNLRIDVVHLAPNLPAEALDRGDLDLVLGRFDEVPARFTRHPWRREPCRSRCASSTRTWRWARHWTSMRSWACGTSGCTAARPEAWSTSGWPSKA
ncbi:HTH-type transcriptional regulator YidZ [Pseudomonas hunanensis]|nr:HTH-type transcriptional regulator YidZ [Pseudomonas hunanensis]